MKRLFYLILLTWGYTQAQSPLCPSYPTSFCCEYVSSITINGQTYAGSNGFAATSGGTGPNGYYDYTGTPVPTINAGDNISISYTGVTNSNYHEYFKLWIDFNGNGDLSDEGELVHATDYTWNGTSTYTSTFTVPTTVFNGEVYMRFIMVYAAVPTLCGPYSYGNTFDFKTTITGAVDPFTHSGTIYGGAGEGLPGVQVSLYSRITPNLQGFTSQTNFNGHSYYRSTSSKPWTEAKVDCQLMGGHLVTITSAAENNFVYTTWPSGWIGFTDEVTEGTFKWVTGEAVTYTNWNNGEPNNSGNEDYTQFVGGGRWNDLPNTSLPYVLEFDYIVDYTQWTLQQTVTTDASGNYSVFAPTNPSIEFYVTFSTPQVPALSNQDGQEGVNIVMLNQPIKSKEYYRYDVNNDDRVTVSDAYYIYAKKNNILGNFPNTPPDSRIFNYADWTVLESSTQNPETTYPGVQTITVQGLQSGGVSNFYIVRTGYRN
jgi:hypothetical protein